MAVPIVMVSAVEEQLERLLERVAVAKALRFQADQLAGDQDAAGCDASNRQADVLVREMEPVVGPLARVALALERQQAVRAVQETLGACEDAAPMGPFAWIMCERPGCDVCDAGRVRESRDADLVLALGGLVEAIEGQA